MLFSNDFTSFMHCEDIDCFKYELHKALILALQKAYNNEKWKYSLIKNAELKFNKKLQYHQLNAFELGNLGSSDILMVVMLELMSFKSFVVIKIVSEGADFIKIDIT